MSKDVMVGTRLSEEMVRELERIEQVEQADRSTTVRKLLYGAIQAWKLDHFADEYAQGRVSMARAAQEAGVSIWQMMDYLRQNKVAVQYDMEDWQHDLAVVLEQPKERR